MVAEIVVPEFGESVVEATVGHWLKAEGDRVAAGEPVVELETEKVNTQIAAEEAGVLRIQRQEGETVHPGDVLALVDPAGAEAAPPGAGQPPERPAAQPAPEPAPAVATAPPEGQEDRGGRVSPVAQKVAAEKGVDLAQVKGSGPGGRVMKEDVEAFLSRQAGDAAIPPAQPSVQQAAQQPPAVPRAPAPAQPSGTAGGRPEQRQRLSRRRLTIARRLVEAQQTAAMLTTFNEIDMNDVVELRKRRKESFKEITGANLGFMSFFVKAAVGALKAFPQINSELQGEEMVLKQYYDIGIAIGDVEGLVVPVLRDADGMTFAQIENAIAAFAQKVKDRTLSLEDLKGGTFTITNGGVFGSMMSTPILNPPQVGILGMHAIKERPVVADGQIVAHPVMYIALTYDHRVVDGRDSVLFLARIKELIEDPERLLLEG